MNEIEKQLRRIVHDYLGMGCLCKDKSLGIKQMPYGYALMLNGDRTHFFWIRHDGCESVISWDKWQVWRWAENDFKKTVQEDFQGELLGRQRFSSPASGMETELRRTNEGN